MKTAIVCGAGGFIGGHMVKRLLSEGYKVVAVDMKPVKDWYQNFDDSKGLFDVTNLPKRSDLKRQVTCVSEGKFDLRDARQVNELIRTACPDELYQFAADMGGAGYIFTGNHDADIMHNSATINLNLTYAIERWSRKTKVFYSSSACIYPKHNQLDPDNPNCEESSAYPAAPDSEYGWEKLFSEHLWESYTRNYKLDVRMARFHNIFGPEGTWDDGKEKAPAAMCRKAVEADGVMEVWGDGQQTRSFLYIDECIEAVRRLMESSVKTVVNIGSDEMIKINDLAKMVIEFSGKDTIIKNIEGPEGVRGRNSDNTLIYKLLGWKPTAPLRDGMKLTFEWIKKQHESKIQEAAPAS